MARPGRTGCVLEHLTEPADLVEAGEGGEGQPAAGQTFMADGEAREAVQPGEVLSTTHWRLPSLWLLSILRRAIRAVMPRLGISGGSGGDQRPCRGAACAACGGVGHGRRSGCAARQPRWALAARPLWRSVPLGVRRSGVLRVSVRSGARCPASHGLSRAFTVCGRSQAAPSGQDKDNAGQGGSVRQPRAPTFRLGSSGRREWRNRRPKRIGTKGLRPALQRRPAGSLDALIRQKGCQALPLSIGQPEFAALPRLRPQAWVNRVGSCSASVLMGPDPKQAA